MKPFCKCASIFCLVYAFVVINVVVNLSVKADSCGIRVMFMKWKGHTCPFMRGPAWVALQ